VKDEGKSIVSELRTALSLARGESAIWLLPTRALVRQFRAQLSGAFETLGVDVEELPTTEDFTPLFAEEQQALRVAVTTPERYSALLSARPMTD